MVAALSFGEIVAAGHISRDEREEEESHEAMSYVVIYKTRAKMIDEVKDSVLLTLHPS
jgi:hypothetical protein